MTALDERALAVTKFWREAGEDAWFEKNYAFDADFRSRFLDLLLCCPQVIAGRNNREQKNQGAGDGKQERREL